MRKGTGAESLLAGGGSASDVGHKTTQLGLTSLLSDSNFAVRREAATALGQVAEKGDQRVIQALSGDMPSLGFCEVVVNDCNIPLLQRRSLRV